jgi:Tfp pilus assembly protein PilV
MTLIEVLISMAIVFIIFLGMSAGGLVVLDRNMKNLQREEAVSVAETEMQKVRNIPFDSLAGDNSVVPRLVRGISRNYTVTRTVTALDSGNRQVSVNVSWTRPENGVDRTYNHQVFTIVRKR